MNPAFKSTPVLSNEMREQIYKRVEIEGASVRKASAEFAVSLERVAAVVRLKAVERKWQNEVSWFCAFISSLASSLYSSFLSYCYEEKNQIFMINLEDFING